MRAEVVMVTDMHRVEQAARLSMGQFQDIEGAVGPARHIFPISLRYAVGALVAVAAMVVVYQVI